MVANKINPQTNAHFQYTYYWGKKGEECALTGEIHQAAYQYSVTPNSLKTREMF